MLQYARLKVLKFFRVFCECRVFPFYTSTTRCRSYGNFYDIRTIMVFTSCFAPKLFSVVMSVAS